MTLLIAVVSTPAGRAFRTLPTAPNCHHPAGTPSVGRLRRRLLIRFSPPVEHDSAGIEGTSSEGGEH
jgi:hypothetical protein